MKETKRERFVRVAEARTQKVLDALDTLSNCSARASYDYTQSDVEQILSAIEQKTQLVRDKFAGVKRFSLSSSEHSFEDQDGVFPTPSSQNNSLDAQIQSAQARCTAEPEEESSSRAQKEGFSL